jgi:AcrR family transcriptional regulator
MSDPDARELGLRERKRLATRRAILIATAELVRERGFDGVTIEEISRVADVSPRTFFNYFGSKEEAVAGELPVLPDQTHIDEFIAGRGDIIAGIGELLAASVVSALDDHEIVRLRKDLMTRYPHLTASRMEGFRQFEEELIAVVDQRLAGQYPDAAPDTRASDARLVTYVALAATRHAWMSWARSDDSASTLLDGLRAAFADLERVLRTSGAN